jgi:hypothetical protein
MLHRWERLEGVADDLEWIAVLLDVSLSAYEQLEDEADDPGVDGDEPADEAVHRIWLTRHRMWKSLILQPTTPQHRAEPVAIGEPGRFALRPGIGDA